MKYYSMACTVDSKGRLSQGGKVAFLSENRDFGVLKSLIETKLTEKGISNSNCDSIFPF
jgi:hypothetical protein